MSSSTTKEVEKCVGCKNTLPGGEQMSCLLCKLKYDLLCANIAPERFQLMDKEQKSSWLCPECRSKQPKAGNTDTPIRTAASIAEEPVVATNELDDSYNITFRRKAVNPNRTQTTIQHSDELCEFNPSDVIPVQEVNLFWNELRAVRLEMSNLRNTLVDVTTIMNKNNERMDTLEARMDSLERKITAEDQSDVEALESQILQLKQDLHDREQDLLSNDIEIAGIPETAGEGIAHIVLSVAAKLGVELEERDIVDAGRVGPQRMMVEGGPTPRPRSISVRLTRRSRREALLVAARVRRGATTADMGLAAPPCRFYVNERLTKLNRKLFQMTREIAGRAKWRFVWTRDGKVFAKQENGSKRHRLRTVTDLAEVFGKGAVRSEIE